MNTPVALFNAPSWRFGTKTVDAALTVRGGMMAPVTFYLGDGRKVEPYYISPWWNDDRREITPNVLVPLRGDFFCLPFGGDNERDGEHHEPHGESASAEWMLGTHDRSSVVCSIDYARGGRVDKTLWCDEETPTIYTEHTVSGFSGKYPLGHHAILHGAPPGADAKAPIWKVFTEPFDLGMTDPGFTQPTAGGEYYALGPGEEFQTLEEVPTRWRNPAFADCSLFPSREGFIDLIAWYRRPVPRVAWTVAYNLVEGYAWFTLKDPRVLPATVMWMENYGRHGSPWNGRNSCVGIEETCSYFANGLNAPADGGAIGRAGIATSVSLNAEEPFRLRTIQGCFAVDDTNDPIVSFDPSIDGGVFVTNSGHTYTLGIDPVWVLSEPGPNLTAGPVR